MGRRRRRRKKTGAGTIFWLSLLIVAGCVVLFGLTNEGFAEKLKGLTTDKVKAKAEEEVLEQVLEQVLQSVGEPEAAEKAKEIMDNFDEADRQKAEEMIGKYVNKDTISDVVDMIEEGVNGETADAVKDYLQESVSEEDREKLRELYEKYRERF